MIFGCAKVKSKKGKCPGKLYQSYVTMRRNYIKVINSVKTTKFTELHYNASAL
jgi:hypothetical protein